MADASSVQACVDRHTAYPYDIAGRLNAMQRQRIADMVAPVRPGETVLDVGCNSGYITDFVPKSCHCFGVDVAPDLVAKARARLIWADVAPAEAIPLEDRSVDVVVLGEILEHVFDPVAVLREARRLARRLVVGSTPHEASVWGPSGRKAPAAHRFHVRCFTEGDLAQTLRAAGCADVQVRTTAWDGRPAFYCFEAGA